MRNKRLRREKYRLNNLMTTEHTPKHREPKWGFWLPVKDRASATYAAKISGLIVFLMGITHLVVGLAMLTGEIPLFGAAIAIFGALCTVSGILARKLDFRTLPLTLITWIILTIIGGSITGPNWGLLLNAIIGLVAISGLRGWWWLRKNVE